MSVCELKTQYDLAMCTGCPESQMDPGLHPEVPGQQVKGGDCPLLSSETPLAVLPPALGLPTKGYGTAGASPGAKGTRAPPV